MKKNNSADNKKVLNAANLPDQRCKVIDIFPVRLFELYRESTCDQNDSVHEKWAEVFISKEGRIYIENNFITYSAHSIMKNTGKTTVEEQASFERLPELIRKSRDKEAAKYRGMNQNNWQGYVTEAPAEKNIIPYDIMVFGDFEWYILDRREDTLLLLSRYGIDSRKWNDKNVLVAWKDSTLCQWLNTDFAAGYLSQVEQERLVKFEDGTRVSLPDEAIYKKYLEKYDNVSAAEPTSKAIRKGAFYYKYSPTLPSARKYVGNGRYWLRTNSLDNSNLFDKWVRCVSWDGKLCDNGCDFDGIIVRPLIRIKKKC